nr:MAG TPA: hypothetical protein [Caudoviricetes sp.]
MADFARAVMCRVAADNIGGKINAHRHDVWERRR